MQHFSLVRQGAVRLQKHPGDHRGWFCKARKRESCSTQSHCWPLYSWPCHWWGGASTHKHSSVWQLTVLHRFTYHSLSYSKGWWVI